MPNAPSVAIQKAFLQPTVNVIRRVEIYEQDETTPWKQDLWDSLLVGGSISIDYDRDERRTLEIELDNSYQHLNPKPNGLWYDKIIKVFYGIRTRLSDSSLRVAIVEQHLATDQAFELREHLAVNGISTVHYLPLANSYDQVESYDVLISISSTGTQKAAFLTSCYNQGKSIITFTLDQTAAQLPLVIGNTATGTVVAGAERVTTPVATAHGLSVGWEEWSIEDSTSYRKILAPAAGAVTVAQHEDDQGQSIAVIAREPKQGPRWVHVAQAKFDEDSFLTIEDYQDFGRFAASAVRWSSVSESSDIWEQSIGKFMIDTIGDGGSYSTVKVLGRDLTKRLMLSKFAVSTTFAKDTPIETIIKAVASNAGIKYMKIPITNKVLDKDTTWERDVSRWDVVRDVANANNYEVYFDHEGYLVMREFRDPLLTPPTLTLAGGPAGNLVSRGAQSSDASLYNHIVVVGEGSDSQAPPVWAEAINTTPGSPTSVAELGDRVSVTTSALITDVSQAQELANTLLAVSALEEFALSFEATLLPWIEPGEILDMSQSDDRYWGPDRYLLTSLTLPLDLSPMSGSGKRVVKVAAEADDE